MGQPRDHRRARYAISAAFGAVGAAICTSGTLAQELASVETELADPPHLRGHEDGARTRVAPPAAAMEPATVAPDWFGGKPYWEWSTATGNWGGIRTWFDEHGITFAGSYTLDWSSVWDGGLRRAASTRSLTDLSLTLDLEKLAGLAGGTVFLDFYSTDGRGGSRDVGDLHAVSNIETSTNVDQVAELWYEQWMFDRLLRVKVGKVDANAEFAFVDTAGSFINSAAGVSTPVFVLPTYPDPATSVNLLAYPTEWLYVGLGLYDGATADGMATGPRGPATFFSDRRSSSWFTIGEIGVRWDRAGALGKGRLAAGGWHHSADFERFDGGIESGTEGFYFVGEQQLLGGAEGGDPGETGLFAFVRYAWADENVTDAGQHVGGGLVLKGTFPGRDEDEVGLFVSRLLLSGAEGAPFEGDETAVELYYRFSLSPFMHVTPDVQWISDPSGDPSVEDAVVGAVRFEVDF